jgi:hypothetical protein
MASATAVYWPPSVWVPAEPEPPPEDLSFWDPLEPTVFQSASWSCSCASSAWVFNACDIPAPSGGKWDEWSVISALRDVGGWGAVSPDYGLAYASMVQLEELWRALGLQTVRRLDISWELALDLAGEYPTQINGGRFYHHVGVRGYAADALLLANPAPTWRGVGQIMDSTEWAVWGLWNALYAIGRA